MATDKQVKCIVTRCNLPQVRTALKTEMQAAFSSANDFSITSVSDYLEPFLRPKLLIDQSSSTLLNLAKNADKKYINLASYQMHVIASKVGVSFLM